MASENSDSQETNSTSLVEDSLNISFKNLGYTVRNGLLSRGKQNLKHAIVFIVYNFKSVSW